MISVSKFREMIFQKDIDKNEQIKIFIKELQKDVKLYNIPDEVDEKVIN